MLCDLIKQVESMMAINKLAFIIYGAN